MTIESEPRARPRTDARASKDYGAEHVDQLPYGTDEKAERYETERFYGATGLNWYTCDPTLQRAMRYYLSDEEFAWAEPHLERLGELMGGPVSERADVTDKIGPKLVKYDRWGHDVSEVVIPESAQATKRDLIERGFSGPAFREAAEAAGIPPIPLTIASGYLLDQAEIGMSCAMGADAGMVASQVAQFAPADIRRACALEARIRRVDRQDRPVLHRAHRRLRPRRARDDGDARRRRLAPERLQVVRLEPRRRGIRRHGQARSARPTASVASRRSWFCGSGATERATASTSASSRRSSARTLSLRARSSSATPRRSCSPATRKAWRRQTAAARATAAASRA